MNNNPQHKGASNSNSPVDLRFEGRLIAAVVALHTPQPVAPRGRLASFFTMLTYVNRCACPVLLFPTGDATSIDFGSETEGNRGKRRESLPV